MPMYDFECTKCGHTFEDIIPSTAANPGCPECGEPTEKVLSIGLGKVKKKSPKAEYYTRPDVQKKLRERSKKRGTSIL
jgi:putative FmdB family regulatory protein